MDINDILKVFQEYGMGSSLVTGGAMLFWFLDKAFDLPSVVSKFIYRIFYNLMGKKPGTESINSKEFKVISESDILNHDIFNYIDFWMYSKIPIFQFSTEYRTIVFRKYLTIFLKKHKDNIKKYVEDKQYQTMDDSQLWTSLLSLINDIIYDYEKEMESVGIPRIIIEKMKVRNNDTISLTIDLLEGICGSQFYTSDKNLLKVYSILNIILSILENTIFHSDQICNSINGQLKNMKFYDNGREFTEP